MFTKSKQEKSKTEKKGEKKRKVFEQLEVFIRLLGIIIDKNLNSMCHTEELCKKATNKTKALFRIQPYLTLERAKGLYHAYILATFKKFQIIPATSLDLEVDYVYHLKTVTFVTFFELMEPVA